jgi:hypothetical protein
LPLGYKGTIRQGINCGEELLILNILPSPLTFSVATIEIVPPFEKG